MKIYKYNSDNYFIEEQEYFNYLDPKNTVLPDLCTIKKPTNLMPYYKWSKTKWVIDKDLKKEFDKNIIKGKLSVLDNQITREEENIYSLMKSKSLIIDSDILQETKDKISKKEKLRGKLNVL